MRKEEDARKQWEQVLRRPTPGAIYDFRVRLVRRQCSRQLQSQAPQEQKCEAEFRERDHLVQAEVRWLG